MSVKNDLLNSFIYSIKNESIHKLESTIYIHIALILLKDDLEFNRKDELINFCYEKSTYGLLYNKEL